MSDGPVVCSNCKIRLFHANAAWWHVGTRLAICPGAKPVWPDEIPKSTTVAEIQRKIAADNRRLRGTLR